ncbi:MAG: hypothetical protein EXS13_04515 [Planctomycetes bacterium]|nr:hypothetical protein [Planctomycetota bacterium]
MLLLAAALLCGESTEWNQRYGGPGNRSTIDVEPIRGEPVEAFRHKFDAILAGPIVSSGRVVVVVREGKERRILSLRADTGAIVARKTLDKGPEPTALVATGGLVVLVDPEKAKPYRLADDSLRPEKAVADGGGNDAMVLDGTVLVRDAMQPWRVLDLATAKVRAKLSLGSGRPSLETPAPGSWRFVAPSRLDDAGNLRFTRADLTLGPAPATGKEQGFGSGLIERIGPELEHSTTVVCTIASSDFVYVWFARRLNAGGVFAAGSGGNVPFVEPPVVHAEHFFGFSLDGELVGLDPLAGKFQRLVEPGTMPKGAARGTPSCARGVLFLGNWALEIESGRVLWCLPGVEPLGPLVPTIDGCAVVRTKGNELVGWSEAGSQATTAAQSESVARPVARPVAPSDDAALAERLKDDERATCEAFRAALRSDQQEAWVKLFDRYAEFKLWDECRRIVTTAQAVGLERARADELTAKAAGKSTSTAGNAELQKRKLASEEQQALGVIHARMVAAAEWCAARRQFVAATVLAGDSTEFLPSKAFDRARLVAWMPAGFPWTREVGNAVHWSEWAAALLPSGARFLAKDDPQWKRVVGSAFAKGTLGLRSANLLLFSREQDPAVVGPALARGEAAVASLEGLLPDWVKASAALPIEVRLHATQADYLADKLADGQPPDAWSAGVYVPYQKVSRFFAHYDVGGGDPLGRTLHGTMAHELTHHWIDVRWIEEVKRMSTLPGTWMVEGIAEYVGEQSVEAARRGEALDDATVQSLDITAAAAKAGQLLPLELLLAINSVTFRTRLEGGALGIYDLRHTLAKVKVDRRGLFYAQSAALTFFALQRCGAEGRKGYLKMLAAYYRGQPPGEAWSKLGFNSAKDFEGKFAEFVNGL